LGAWRVCDFLKKDLLGIQGFLLDFLHERWDFIFQRHPVFLLKIFLPDQKKLSIKKNYLRAL
jgi:hypothetical protein